MVRRRALAVAAALMVGLPALTAGAVETPQPSCLIAIGEPVVLRSSDFDPDVLVWDSRQRAVDYAGGGERNETELLTHTVLTKPGTRAIVLACIPASVRPKYATETLDTVGVKLTTGPQRGHYGWVTSDDVRDSHSSQVPTTVP